MELIDTRLPRVLTDRRSLCRGILIGVFSQLECRIRGDGELPRALSSLQNPISREPITQGAVVVSEVIAKQELEEQIDHNDSCIHDAGVQNSPNTMHMHRCRYLVLRP